VIAEQTINDSVALLGNSPDPFARTQTVAALTETHPLPETPTPAGMCAAWPYLKGPDVWPVQPDGYVPLFVEGKPDASPAHAVPVSRVHHDGPRPDDPDAAAWYAQVLADLRDTEHGLRWHRYPDEDCCDGRLHTLPNDSGFASLAVPQIAWSLLCDWLPAGQYADRHTALVVLTSQADTIADLYWGIDVPRCYLTREVDFLNALARRLAGRRLDPATDFLVRRCFTTMWARLPCAEAGRLTAAARALIAPGALSVHERRCPTCRAHPLASGRNAA
jgi:hypothetical protein